MAIIARPLWLTRMRRAPSAFTLVELLVVVAIASVVLGLALPSLQEGIARYRLRIAADALLESIARGRARAVWHNRRITVCASDGGTHCAPEADWGRGWLTIDPMSGSVRERHPALDARLSTVHRNGRRTVDFAPNGTSPGDNQSVILCVSGRPSSALSIVISNAGLAHRGTATSADAEACAAASSRKRKDA